MPKDENFTRGINDPTAIVTINESDTHYNNSLGGISGACGSALVVSNCCGKV